MWPEVGKRIEPALIHGELSAGILTESIWASSHAKRSTKPHEAALFVRFGVISWIVLV
jgi:hypothetical protein